MTEKEVIEAFNNPKRGLTSNVKLLKKRFPNLKDLGPEKIREILIENSEIYQRNRKIKREKIFRSYSAGYVGQLIHMDLMTLNVSKNKQKILIEDYKYLLVAVDTYSRMLFCRLLKTKQKNEVKEGVDSILLFIREDFYGGSSSRTFTVLTDKGGEFSYKNEPNIIFKKSKNKYGAVLSEYWIYKIRDKIRLYDPREIKELTEETLEDIIENINDTIASSISDKYTPNEIFYELKHPEKDIKLYEHKESKINVGDFVRLVNYEEKEGKIFAKKSAYNNYTKKIFSVLYLEQDSIQYIYQYRLISLDSKNVLDMLFYEHELLPIKAKFVKEMSDQDFILNCIFTEEEKKLYKIRKAVKEDFAE